MADRPIRTNSVRSTRIALTVRPVGTPITIQQQRVRLHASLTHCSKALYYRGNRHIQCYASTNLSTPLQPMTDTKARPVLWFCLLFFHNTRFGTGLQHTRQSTTSAVKELYATSINAEANQCPGYGAGARLHIDDNTVRTPIAC